ncbi:MAG: TIGR03546 family protein, partial [Planctomycetota bacterium]
MFIRKIGKVLRGDATPAQIMLACVLGSVLGFMPGFPQAGGLIVACIVLLVVLNANLTLAVFVGIAAKLISLALISVSFAVGRFLLDGPTSGLFVKMINAP